MRAVEQHSGKVLEAGVRFKHVMALALNPKNLSEGIIRGIIDRSGDVGVKGNIDRSELYTVRMESPERAVLGERLHFTGEEELLAPLTQTGWDCIGFEDPDIWAAEDGTLHVYFTMPFKKMGEHTRIELGHAEGPSLGTLRITQPALAGNFRDKGIAKEVSIAPKNTKGVRYNLFESNSTEKGIWYSTVRMAIVENMGKPWQAGDTLFNPKDHAIPWIGGHASPGPLLPRSFVDVGEHKLLGIINGREANTKKDGKTLYGTFSVGLFIYDYEKGKIDWVSPEPLIRDTEAKNITFASQFVETGSDKGILYAHVDDSFVRAYTLYAQGIKELLPLQ